eukprot:Blabericola_migrator_1__2566@NODE_1724_length_3921_cov_660_524131_g1114_i0_p1_GENE_NODE_1724_length_3921_cov_660_524131_g1114_i0NODE_1724_length_3921_cov_660_524131_g1114_i0_p1_ORF_typecomplete_len448_score83_24RVT_1/PF00078_27/4_1e10RVT_1/PF00078_27/27RVT_3/PF13456_6/1_9e03RVT_3/PF13456_6/1e05RNase_H/PF00075_24/27RNase_H/PF00075_24/0_057DNA_pol_viral_C/PF00336_18/0_026ImpA_N/PF06812_12/0_043Speriolin_C/PF15059_6/0_085Speriolin_C/PF15059_6/4_5e02Speriolin_C/PF15059_6/5_6e03Maf/PF02545_14/0_075Cl
MPMGAQGAPKFFNHVMSLIMKKLPDHLKNQIRFYQDDIFVAGEDEAQMKTNYQEVKSHMEKQGFKLNMDKSSMQEQIRVLGIEHDRKSRCMRINSDTIKDLRKAVWQLQTPQWRQGIQHINGISSWLTDWIPANWKKELTTLRQCLKKQFLSKVTKDIWMEFPDMMTRTVKKITACDQDSAITLTSDASASGIGLVATINEARIADWFIPWQQAASSAYLEMEGLRRILQKALKRLKELKQALNTNKLVIQSDNMAVVSLLKKPSNTEAGEIARRIITMMEIMGTIEVHHIHGSINIADPISRQVLREGSIPDGRKNLPGPKIHEHQRRMNYYQEKILWNPWNPSIYHKSYADIVRTNLPEEEQDEQVHPHTPEKVPTPKEDLKLDLRKVRRLGQPKEAPRPKMDETPIPRRRASLMSNDGSVKAPSTLVDEGPIANRTRAKTKGFP